MKNSPLSIVNLVLVIIVGAIAVTTMLSKGDTDSKEGQVVEQLATNPVKIAYVNVDSLLMNYNMSKDLNEELMQQSETARTDLSEKVRQLESEMVEFRRKLENNGFLSRERAEKENQRLVQKRQDLELLDQKLSNELRVSQQEVSQKLLTTITTFLEKYNKKQGYELILSTTVGGNVLYAKKGYDITNQVLSKLNAEYSAK